MPEYFSPSKINLFLNILGKRPDGFHELETLMVPLTLGDTLTLNKREDDRIVITCNVPGVPCDEGNLAYKAVKIVSDHCGLQGRGVTIHLEKKTPVAAGMGGGSSNGATVIRALNELWSLGLETTVLEQLCAKLGSDCAFFIRNQPAVCTGRGEVITPIPWKTALHLIITNPGFGISTKWSYETLAQTQVPQAPPLKSLVESLVKSDWEGVRRNLFNSLEYPAFGKYVTLPVIKDSLLKNGATASMMSGSGATVFGMAESAEAATSVAEKMRKEYGPGLFVETAALYQS